jgi:hypothetical protein
VLCAAIGGIFGLVLDVGTTTFGCNPASTVKVDLLLMFLLQFAAGYAIAGGILGFGLCLVWSAHFPGSNTGRANRLLIISSCALTLAVVLIVLAARAPGNCYP